MVWDYLLRHVLWMIFQEKYFSWYILLTDQNSLSGCLYFFLEILGNMYTVIFCCPIYDVINFEINLSFLIKSFFYTTEYGCSFVAKLSWKKNCFLKKYCGFYKIYMICSKKNFFYREKYKWKGKKFISHFRNIFLHRKCLVYK